MTLARFRFTGDRRITHTPLKFKPKATVRIIDLAGGIIQNHHQVMPALVVQPSIFVAVDVQQHPRRRRPSRMRRALAPLVHRPRSTSA